MSRKVSDWLQGYLDYTDNSEPPELFRLWVAISAISSALQRKCFLPWGTLTFYPNMYIVLVAPSGKARKGTAIGPGMELIENLGIPMAAEAITREALIQTLGAAQTSTPDPTSGDIHTHSSLTIISPELTVFLGYQNHQLMSDLTDWYDCRSKWTYRTKNMGTDDVLGVFVNLLGATTPDLIRTTLPLDAIGGGLTSRIIFVFEPRKGKTVAAPFLSQKEKILGADLMHDLEQINLMSGKFQMTQGALALWVEWYTENSEINIFDDTRFDGYTERRPNHVMKLSMIISAARRDGLRIEKQDLKDAISLLERTEVKMPLVFAGVGRSATADLISELMADIGNNKEVTLKELTMRYYRDCDYRQLEGILQTIEKTGFCSIIHEERGTIIKHNPSMPKDSSLAKLLANEN